MSSLGERTLRTAIFRLGRAGVSPAASIAAWVIDLKFIIGRSTFSPFSIALLILFKKAVRDFRTCQAGRFSDSEIEAMISL